MNSGEVLSDLLAPGLAVVFVGTAVGTTSAVRQAYYAGPGNKFWRIVAETGLTAESFLWRRSLDNRTGGLQ